jgi:hypothetical protein
VAAASLVTFFVQRAASVLLVNESEPRALWLLALGVIDGVMFGVIAGAAEWWLLRRALGMSPLWIAFTLLGTIAASVASMPFGSYFAWAASLGGAVLGTTQWPLLRDHLRNAWLWIVVSALVGLAYGPLLHLSTAFPAARGSLAPALAALKALLTGLTLQYLARRSESAAPVATQS